MAPSFRLGWSQLHRSPHSLWTRLPEAGSQVDHKKGDQKCMMSHRVLGQKKNIVTSAPILLSKACHMAKHQTIASFTALQVTRQKEGQNEDNTSMYDAFHNVPLFWYNCLSIVTLETLNKIDIPGLFHGFEYFWHYQPPPASTSLSNSGNRAS